MNRHSARMFAAAFALATLYATGSTRARPNETAEGEITVTGSRRTQKTKDTTVTVEVIRREDLEQEGAQNAADALANVPGIEIRPGQPGQRGEIVRLQGLDTRHVLILINGDRITGRFDGGIDLTRIKVEEIERIEIIKGSTSALYGSDAIGGVINIITREPTAPLQGDFTAQWGSGRELHYGSGGEANVNSRLGFRNENLASNFYAGWHRSDGWDLTPDASPGARSDRVESQSDVYDPSRKNISRGVKLSALALKQNEEIEDEPLENSTGNAFRDLSAGNNSTFFLTKATKLRTNLNYRYLEQDGVDTSPPRAVYDRHTETHDYMVGIGPEVDFGRGRFTTKYSYARFLDTYTQDQRGSDALDRKDVTDDEVSELRMQLDYDVNRDHTLTVGTDGLLEELSSPRIALACATNPPFRCIHEELDVPPARVNGRARRGRGAVFAQDDWVLRDAPRVTITPGVRYESDTLFGSATMPRLAFRLDPTNKLKLRMAYGQGFRAPSFKELYFSFQNPGAGYQVVGNQDLEPERSWSANANAEYELNRWFWFSFGLFQNEIENLIDFRRRAGYDADGLVTFQTANYKRALTRGGESSVSLRLDLGAHESRLDLGYAYTDARDLDTDLPLEGRAAHRGTFQLSYEYTPLRIGFRLFGSVYGRQAFYCEKSPFHCVDVEQFPDFTYDRQTEYLAKFVQPDTVELCDYYGIRACGSDPEIGFSMENPYNIVNVRVYKKWGDLELFAGVDNMLDEYDLRYNLIRPRFMYAGLTASLEPLSDLKAKAIRQDPQFNQFRESEDYRRFQESPEYRKLRERREIEEFEEYKRFRSTEGDLETRPARPGPGRNAPEAAPTNPPDAEGARENEDEVKVELETE